MEGNELIDIFNLSQGSQSEQSKFYIEMEQSMIDSFDIGVLKQDREKILNFATMIILFGLKANAPVYSGNLRDAGINKEMISSTKCNINILAPGGVNKKGEKMPDYGWQTDMLDRLQFYNEDLEYIDVENRNKGWVERSIYSSLNRLIEKF